MGSDLKCRVCGGDDVIEVLNMGKMPNANGLVSKEQLKDVKSYPLKYHACFSIPTPPLS